MSRNTSLCMRVASQAFLVVFTLSTVGCTMCSGHDRPHAARASSWVDMEAAVAGAHWTGDTATGAGETEHHSDRPDDHEEGCNPPVYLVASPLDGQGKAPDDPPLLDVIHATPALLPPLVLPPRLSWTRLERPPPIEDPLSISARLRL